MMHINGVYYNIILIQLLMKTFQKGKIIMEGYTENAKLINRSYFKTRRVDRITLPNRDYNT